MLEWTGERFLPWVKDPSLAYEHLHRYAYAAKLVRGKRVLDLASGEGYGSNLLAQQAQSVIGVDIDPEAVEHASARYGNRGANVQFITGSVTNVPIPDSHSFDAVVCFEAIEHIDDHAALLSEVKRLLRKDGLLIISTPNKLVYQDHSKEDNPFHLRELTFEEFRVLLTRQFKYARFLGQRIHAESSIWPIEGKVPESREDFSVEREGEEYAFTSADKRVPLYIIGLASDAPLKLPDIESSLVDQSNLLLEEKDRALRELLEGKESLQEALSWREKQLGESAKSYEAAEEALKWKDDQILRLNEGIKWLKNQNEELSSTIQTHEKTLAWRAEQAVSYQTILANMQQQLDEKLAELSDIQSSAGWKFILAVRRLNQNVRSLLRFGSPQP
jgi:SAM-dependent methyltransferase